MPQAPARHTPQRRSRSAREKFTFDVEGAIMFFGGFTSFQDHLTAHGMLAPDYNNFRGWRSRRTMSADLIARMVRLAHILELPFDLNNYLIEPVAQTHTLPPAAIKTRSPFPEDDDEEFFDEDGNELTDKQPPAATHTQEPVEPATLVNPVSGQPEKPKPVSARAMRRQRNDV